MIALPVLAALFYGGGASREPLQPKVSPQTIPVGMFYNGADVTVEGAVTAGSGVIVTVTGSESEAVFNKKARFGPVWVNSGKVRISGAPSLFLRFSSAPISGLLGPDSVARYRLDDDSLIRAMRTEPRAKDERTQAALGRDYLALKKTDGTYILAGGGIDLSAAGGGSSFALRFRWPKQAPPGAYQIHVYEVTGGAVTRAAEIPVSVIRTGFPAWLAALAGNHASRYGVTAVVIGVLAGFGIDFLTTLLFGKKRAVSH